MYSALTHVYQIPPRVCEACDRRMSGRVTFDSWVRGYHVNKSFWNPSIGDTLLTKCDFGHRARTCMICEFIFHE